MPSALIMADALAGLVSPVAIATIAADFVSAMNNTPSGPNASWFMALNSGLPSFIPATREADTGVETSPRASAVRANETGSFFMGMFGELERIAQDALNRTTIQIATPQVVSIREQRSGHSPSYSD